MSRTQQVHLATLRREWRKLLRTPPQCDTKTQKSQSALLQEREVPAYQAELKPVHSWLGLSCTQRTLRLQPTAGLGPLDPHSRKLQTGIDCTEVVDGKLRAGKEACPQSHFQSSRGILDVSTGRGWSAFQECPCCCSCVWNGCRTMHCQVPPNESPLPPPGDPVLLSRREPQCFCSFYPFSYLFNSFISNYYLY